MAGRRGLVIFLPSLPFPDSHSSPAFFPFPPFPRAVCLSLFLFPWNAEGGGGVAESEERSKAATKTTAEEIREEGGGGREEKNRCEFGARSSSSLPPFLPSFSRLLQLRCANIGSLLSNIATFFFQQRVFALAQGTFKIRGYLNIAPSISSNVSYDTAY